MQGEERLLIMTTLQSWYEKGYRDHDSGTHLSTDELSRLTRAEREAYLDGYWAAYNDDAGEES
jgi:hypothetical protein